MRCSTVHNSVPGLLAWRSVSTPRTPRGGHPVAPVAPRVGVEKAHDVEPFAAESPHFRHEPTGVQTSPCGFLQENQSAPHRQPVSFAVHVHAPSLTGSRVRTVILSVQKSKRPMAPRRGGSSPLAMQSTSSTDEKEAPAPAEPECRSPERTTKPADGPAPSSPGLAQVSSARAKVHSAAQLERERKKALDRAKKLRQAKEENMYDKVNKVYEAKKHHRAAHIIKMMCMNAEKACQAAEDAVHSTTWARVEWLEACLDTEVARVAHRDAQLASLRRRLRKRSLMHLCRW